MTEKKHHIDTVSNAENTPERELPYRELGVTDQEYQQIVTLLGRRPTSGELAMYSVMWSEHCSYKSSKVHLRQFGKKMTESMKKNLMVGMGQNAGVVDVGEGWAVTFKIESHNHPSFIEPFQGAATGVGGIVRDIIRWGHDPSESWTRCALVRLITPTPLESFPEWSPESAFTATASVFRTSVGNLV